jgi:hypothetical protein
MFERKPPGAFAELIPELQHWNNGTGIDVDGWIRCVGNFEHAIGYGRLFWPEFHEHDGCVFWKESFDEANYRHWLEATGGDKRATQAMMNHEHLAELFSTPDLQPTRAQLVYVGRVLQDIWGTKLKRDFPGMHVIVDLFGEDSEDLRDIQITVYRHVEAAV